MTAHSEVYPIELYLIKFVSDLRQDVGFLRVLLLRISSFPQVRMQKMKPAMSSTGRF